MSYKTQQDKKALNYPWTARQARRQQGIRKTRKQKR